MPIFIADALDGRDAQAVGGQEVLIVAARRFAEGLLVERFNPGSHLKHVGEFV